MDRRLKKVLNEYEVPNILNTKMQETIRCAKTELQKQNLIARPSFIEVLIGQLQYISSTVWIAQIIIIGIFSVLLMNSEIHLVPDISILSVISACGPIIALIGVPELSKSFSYNMWEIEDSCTFNLYKLMSMRLMIVGMIDIIVMTILVAISSTVFIGSFISLVLYMFVPFNLAGFIYLIIINRIKSKNVNYITVATGIFISVVLNQIIDQTQLYKSVSTGIWGLMFFVSAVLLIWQVAKSILQQKQQEELQWNSI